MPQPKSPGPDGKWVDTWTDEELQEQLENPSDEMIAQRRQMHKDDAWLFRAAMHHLYRDDGRPAPIETDDPENKETK